MADQKVFRVHAIAPHHRDRTDLNFITHTGSNLILKPDGARFLNLTQHVFTGRIQNTTTIVTSNLDFSEWDQAFPSNPLLAAASLDRLRHNAYCLVLEGQSYRTPKVAPKFALQTAQKRAK